MSKRSFLIASSSPISLNPAFREDHSGQQELNFTPVPQEQVRLEEFIENFMAKAGSQTSALKSAVLGDLAATAPAEERIEETSQQHPETRESKTDQVLYPYSTQVFPHAIQNLLVGFAVDLRKQEKEKFDRDLDISGIRGDGSIIKIEGYVDWSPFSIEFILTEKEEMSDSEFAEVDCHTYRIMEDFYDVLQDCVPDGVEITKKDSITYRISCTHPEQLLELVQNFIEETDVDTLDNSLLAYEPTVQKKEKQTEEDIKLENFIQIKSAWERRSYIDAQLSVLKKARENYFLGIPEDELEDVLPKIQDQTLDFIPSRPMPNYDVASLTGWFLTHEYHAGAVSIQNLRYAILSDTKAPMPLEFALRGYQ